MLVRLGRTAINLHLLRGAIYMNLSISYLNTSFPWLKASAAAVMLLTATGCGSSSSDDDDSSSTTTFAEEAEEFQGVWTGSATFPDTTVRKVELVPGHAFGATVPLMNAVSSQSLGVNATGGVVEFTIVWSVDSEGVVTGTYSDDCGNEGSVSGSASLTGSIWDVDVSATYDGGSCVFDGEISDDEEFTGTVQARDELDALINSADFSISQSANVDVSDIAGTYTMYAFIPTIVIPELPDQPETPVSEKLLESSSSFSNGSAYTFTVEENGDMSITTNGKTSISAAVSSASISYSSLQEDAQGNETTVKGLVNTEGSNTLTFSSSGVTGSLGFQYAIVVNGEDTTIFFSYRVGGSDLAKN